MAIEDKIAALLAKAASTEFEDERIAYDEAAQRLMLKWGVDEAVARARTPGEREEIVRVKLDYPGQYGRSFAHLAGSICDGLGTVKLVMHQYPHWSRDGQRGDRQVEVFGFRRDVDRAVGLVASIQVQATTAMSAWWKMVTADPWMKAALTDRQKKRMRIDFVAAYGNRVGQRLTELRREEEQAVVGSALVVRTQQIDEAVADAYGELKEESMRLNAMSHRAGDAAGRTADIGLDRVTASSGYAIGSA